MNAVKKKQCRRLEQSSLIGKFPEVRVVNANESKRSYPLLGKYQYLEEGMAVGYSLRMLAGMGTERVRLVCSAILVC